MFTRPFFFTLLSLCLVSALALAEGPTTNPSPPNPSAVPGTVPNTPPASVPNTPPGTQPPSAAASPTAPAPGAVGAADMTPQAVLSKIHEINQMEIHMGKMAKKEAKNRKVKRYAERMIRDHEKADRQTRETAKKEGIFLAAAVPSPDDTAEMDKLKTLSGADFDQEYLKAMREGHDKAIAYLTQASDQVTNTRTKQLVNKVLPVVQEHRNIAAKLESAR